MKSIAIYQGMIVAVIFTLTGCLNLGPEYRQPEVLDATPESFLQGIVPGDQVVYGDKWWGIFNDPELNNYMEAVLAYNWDIERTAGRILELRALTIQTRADRFPTVNIDWQHRKDRRNVERRSNDFSVGRERKTFNL